MKKTYSTLCIMLAAIIATNIAAAQVNIGSAAAPNANATLELSQTDKGLLLARVALTSTTLAAPLSAHVAGMIVYNTATINDVVPGMYQNNGIRWEKISTANGASSLGVGDSYVYSASIPYNTWASSTYLDAYVAPTVATVPALPVLDGLTMTARLNGSNDLYSPVFRNVSGAVINYSMTSRATVDGYSGGANKTLADNTYQTTFDDVYLSTSNNEVEQIDLTVNNKWYRILYFSTLDAADATGNYTIRISIIRLL